MAPRLLGKRAPRTDTRTLRLADYLNTARLPAPPQVWHPLGSVDGPWPMRRNDEVGDCTVAAVANAVSAWGLATNEPAEIDDDDVVAAYSAVSGYNPDDPETDRGAVMLDVLRHWRKVGVGEHKLEVFVSVELRNRRLHQTAAWLAGGMQVGAMLPESAREQMDAGQPWTFSGRKGKDKPGSWGGHAIYLCGYDQRWAYFRTWDLVQPAEWKWVDTYCDELFACLDEQDWFDAAGKAPNGFDYPRLRADLRHVTR